MGRDPAWARLPGRAIAGGFLVTVAAVGTFAAYANASGGPTQLVVVTTRNINPGEVLRPNDVRTAEVDAAPTVSARLYSNVGDVAGAVALAPFGPDEPISRSAVSRPSTNEPGRNGPTGYELSVSIDRERAFDGQVQRGEWIDLLATYGTGTDAFTVVVASHARVLDVAVPSKQTLSSSGRLTLELSLENRTDVLESTLAGDVAKLTIVRSSEAAPGALTDGEASRVPTGPPVEVGRRAPPGRQSGPAPTPNPTSTTSPTVVASLPAVTTP